MSKHSLAFALDYPTIASARPTLQSLCDAIGFAKIGLELFTREGPSAVQQVLDLGPRVFLDLKLHDIPETVERAVAAACALNAHLLTIHCSGGPAMIERAVKRCELEHTGLRLVGVTVLTSLDASDLSTLGVSAAPSEQVLRLAQLGFQSGLRAFVCSPHEVGSLRKALGPEPTLITPGIRLVGADTQDQKRASTPTAAILNGADILVVGRPIRDAKSPPDLARQILNEIDQARASLPQGSL